MKYRTAFDFRKALTDRLNRQAQEQGVDVARLIKRVVFERFLARLFYTGSERWVLKGGYALELRLSSHARATRDLDLNIPPPPLDDLLEELQRAAEIDLADFFSFRVRQAKGELIGPPLGGHRFHVEALLDGRVYASFPLDLGQGDETVREPEWVAGKADLTFAGLPTPTFAAYPLEDHFAEKFHAYTRPRENPSRVKDLVDMLLLIELGLELTPLLQEAIRETFARYATHPLPKRLPEPPETWAAPFNGLTEEIGLEISLENAYEQLSSFLQDVLVTEG